MMARLLSFAFLGLLLTLSAWVSPPEDIESLINRFKAYLQANPSEKVYIHTDKPYYAASDTLWMKAYLVDGILHQADSVSRALYVRLTDEKGNEIAKKTVRVAFGYGQSYFVLPDSIAQGTYQLTGFTNWMRNQADDYYFKKSFAVYRSDNKEYGIKTNDGLDVQFFPEGGNLVNEVVCKVGFKAVNSSGKGIDIEGVIEEIGTGVVSEFKSEHLGMGVFNHYAKPNKQYIAKVKYGGKELTFPLPKAYETGSVLSIGNLLADNIKVTFTHHISPEKLAAETFHLVIHARGQIRYVGELPKEPSKTFYIARAKLPDEGILHFTLFDKNANPLCERIVFNRLNQRLGIKIEPSKQDFSPREKVELQITTTDTKGAPIAANLSLAAISEAQIPDNGLFTDHIVSSLLLTSDLRGTIEQPAYYFDSDNVAAPRHLDLLMMTQGWRRFTWKEVGKETPTKPPYAFEQGLTVNGRINGIKKKKDENPKASFLMNANSGTLFLEAEPDNAGEFSIPNVDFSGIATLTLKSIGKSSNVTNTSLLLQAIAIPDLKTSPIPFSPIAIEKAQIQNYLTKVATQRQVQQALLANKTVTPTPEKNKKSDAGDPRRSIYGTPDFTLKMTDAITDGTTDIMQLITGRLPGVNVSGGRILIRGVSSFVAGTDPLFLLDGVPVDMGALASVPPKQVEAIDLLKGSAASALGTRGANGVIAVLTKRTPTTQDQSLASNQVRGFELGREFYSPRYDTPKRMNNLPDSRSTLYWNPMIQTNANGKATVTFWNSDERTTVRIVAEGATAKGLLGTAKQTYSISNIR